MFLCRQATQGLPTLGVLSSPSDDKDLELPHFDDDEQLYHFVRTRLRRTLKDCSIIFNVSLVRGDFKWCLVIGHIR